MATTSEVAKKLLLPFELKPKYGCFICHQQFYEHELKAYESHVTACAVVNEQHVMEEMSTRHRMRDILAVGDHELDRWVKEHRPEIIAGRKRY